MVYEFEGFLLLLLYLIFIYFYIMFRFNAAYLNEMAQVPRSVKVLLCVRNSII